jgi:hypothetical protein
VIAIHPNLTITVTVSNVDTTLTMHRQLNSGWFLYSCPIANLTPGFHRIEFSGDWEHISEFFVGDHLPSFREPVCRERNKLWSAEFGVYLVIVLNLVLLWQFPPGRIRNCLIAAYLAPIAVPISMIEIEGHIGYNFWYGYFAGGTFFYDVWGQLLAFVYELGIVLPAVLLAGRGHWVEIAIAAGGWTWAFRFAQTAITEAAGRLIAWTSPLFVFVPVVLYGRLMLSRIAGKKSEKVD